MDCHAKVPTDCAQESERLDASLVQQRRLLGQHHQHGSFASSSPRLCLESRGPLRDNILVDVGAADARAIASTVMKSFFMMGKGCCFDRFVKKNSVWLGLLD